MGRAMATKSFQEEHPFEKRAEVDGKKYLVPSELTVAQFQYVVRKRLRLPAEQAMFLFFDGRLPSANSVPLTQLYNDHKDQDGFLYVTYSGENTFGTTL